MMGQSEAALLWLGLVQKTLRSGHFDVDEAADILALVAAPWTTALTNPRALAIDSLQAALKLLPLAFWQASQLRVVKTLHDFAVEPVLVGQLHWGVGNDGALYYEAAHLPPLEQLLAALATLRHEQRKARRLLSQHGLV